jgi:hypothetical protein
MAEPFAAQQRAWGRWTPLAGVAAVVLWVTSVLTGGAVPDTFEATGDEWLTYITGNEGRILVSRLLFLLGDFLFIWFLATLRTRLSAAEEEPRLLTAVAFGSGIATAVMLIAAVTPVLAASAARRRPRARRRSGTRCGRVRLLHRRGDCGGGPRLGDRGARDSHGRPAGLARLGQSRPRARPARALRPRRVHRGNRRVPALGACREHPALAER